jgi:thermostable 8-oxoguanine DNA glycosylase
MDYFKRDVLAFTSPKALSSPNRFFRSVSFVLATIQQRFDTVAMIVERLETEGSQSRFLFGSKREGYEFASENRRVLLKQAQGFVKGKMSLEALILEFMEIPGLGLAKASFLAQIVVGDGACLDRHNLRFLGLPESFVKAPKTLQPASLFRKVEAYNETWRKHGNSALWWNQWCDHVASIYPKSFRNGAAVSALHRIAV